VTLTEMVERRRYGKRYRVLRNWHPEDPVDFGPLSECCHDTMVELGDCGHRDRRRRRTWVRCEGCLYEGWFGTRKGPFSYAWQDTDFLDSRPIPEDDE
jgi:hypothetical protein